MASVPPNSMNDTSPVMVPPLAVARGADAARCASHGSPGTRSRQRGCVWTWRRRERGVPRLPVDRRYSGRMSSPWWRRLPSDVALAASALVPWAVVLFQGLVIAPITYVDSSLLAAYDEIAPAWGTVGSLPITLVLGLIAGSFA